MGEIAPVRIPRPGRLTMRAAAAELTQRARRIASLQRKQRELRKQLKEIGAELRTARRELKAIVRDVTRDNPYDQAPPLRVFGETQDGR